MATKYDYNTQVLSNIGSAGSFTAGTLAGAYVLPVLGRPQITYSDDIIEREIYGNVLAGQEPSIRGKYTATVVIRFEVSGSGAAGTAPMHDVIYRSAGLIKTVSADTSVTYTCGDINDGSSDAPVIDLAVIQDGIALKMHSCRSNITISGEAGAPLICEATIMGVVDDLDASQALISSSLDFSNYSVPPVFAKANAFQWSSTSIDGVRSFSIDLGNNVVMETSANDASGYNEARITRRNTTFSFTANRDTGNLNADNMSQTDAINIGVGASAGNIIDIDTSDHAVITGQTNDDTDGIITSVYTGMVGLGTDSLPGDTGQLTIAFT